MVFSILAQLLLEQLYYWNGPNRDIEDKEQKILMLLFLSTFTIT